MSTIINTNFLFVKLLQLAHLIPFEREFSPYCHVTKYLQLIILLHLKKIMFHIHSTSHINMRFLAS